MAKKRKSAPTLLTRWRNPLHDHPLMKKGAVHEKGHKAERRQNKVRLMRQWDDPSRLVA